MMDLVHVNANMINRVMLVNSKIMQIGNAEMC